MSVFKYAVVAAVGYYVGQPYGRRQVQRLREQAVELVHGPRAKQLQERGGFGIMQRCPRPRWWLRN